MKMIISDFVKVKVSRSSVYATSAVRSTYDDHHISDIAPLLAHSAHIKLDVAEYRHRKKIKMRRVDPISYAPTEPGVIAVELRPVELAEIEIALRAAANLTTTAVVGAVFDAQLIDVMQLVDEIQLIVAAVRAEWLHDTEPPRDGAGDED